MQCRVPLAVQVGVWTALATVLIGLGTRPVHAQIPAQHQVFGFVGPPSQHSWGVDAGDVNKDGYSDILMSSWRRNVGNIIGAGGVDVYSGRDGRILHTINGTQSNEYLGIAVAGAGDVDKDGYSDLVVGIGDPTVDTRILGGVAVYSGKSGKKLYSYLGANRQDALGTVVAGLGDVNLDGYDDFAASAPQIGDLGRRIPVGKGYVHVYSGKDGKRLYTLTGDQVGDRFHIVTGVGDINRDAFPDFAVGAPEQYNYPNPTRNGYVRVFSGRDGKTLATIRGDTAGDWFGWSVAGAGDVNNDNWPDVVVGAFQGEGPNIRTSASAKGYVKVISGQWIARQQGPQVLHTWKGQQTYDLFGNAVAGVGDINRDGYADVVVNQLQPLQSASSFARVFSGKDGKVLWTVAGTSVYNISGPVGGVDIDQDGVSELIVERLTNTGTGGKTLTQIGIHVLSYQKLALATDTHQVSVTNGGTQRLLLDAGSANAGRNYWVFGSVTGSTPGVTLGSSTGTVTIPLVADLYTNLTIALANTGPWVGTRGTLDANGRGQASIVVPRAPTVLGVVLYHAYLVYDPQNNFYMASNPTTLLTVK